MPIDAADVHGEGIHACEGSVAPTAPDAHGAALPALRAKLVAARESERSRIARELHDDLGQRVAVLLMKLEKATHDPHVSTARLLVSLSETRHGLQELASAIRKLSHELCPGRLRLLGLEQTLRVLCREVSTGSHAQVSFHADDVPTVVSEAAALALVRVAQESLRNALEHSEARIIDALLTGGPAQLTLRVTDDGKGFDFMALQPAGIGLLTMRERVELLGGGLIVTTAPGRGTAIEATVPLIGRPFTGVSARV
jgi:signal transduction histidine kinase